MGRLGSGGGAYTGAVADVEAESGLTLAGTETRIAGIETDVASGVTQLGLDHVGVAKPSNQGLINSATLQNDSALVVALEASVNYRLTLLAIVVADNTTPDMKIGWTLPTGATMRWENQSAFVAAGLAPLTGGSVLVLPCDTTELVYLVTGIVYMSTTAGNLQLQWAQNVASVGVQTTMQAQSILSVEKIP